MVAGTQELVERKDTGQAVVGNTPADMIRMAVSGGADLEQLEKLLALQERYEQNEARKAYHKAMAAFKSNPIKINKDKKVGYSTSKGSVGYSHATLANVVDKITAELSKHGLSASWNTNQNGKIKVTCRITHFQGHSEETALEANADDSGSKNSIQAIGSTITYLERYTLLAALGLATQDQVDDDGKGATALITEKQLGEIRDMLIAVGDEQNEAVFAKWLGVEDLRDLPASKFKQAIAALNAKKAKKGAK
jgi:hypothetical protein